MAKRLGIAADLETRKWELDREFKNVRDWQVTLAFDSRKDALIWLKATCDKYKAKTVADGKSPARLRDPWYGFMFEHDGPYSNGA